MTKTKVLVVDDDADHQQLIKAALEARPNTDVRTLGSRREFLRVIDEHTFDCILADFHLADGCATELLQVLSRQGIASPVLVMSSSAAQDAIIETIRSGGADFVPEFEVLQPDLLWRRIDQALSERRKARHARQRIRRRIKRLSRLARADPLTGLANHYHLQNVLLGRGKRSDRLGPISVVSLDVDRFKWINDIHGHAFGDRVLQSLTRVLRDSLAEGHTACRPTGEAFLVLQPGTPLARAVAFAEGLRSTVEGLRLTCDGRPVPVTVSVGIATHSGEQIDRELLSAGDQALRLAKATGRNRVCTWEMVRFLGLLDRSVVAREPSPEQRLRKMIELRGEDLGPTQRDHLTSHAAFVSQLSTWIGSVLGLDAQSLERVRMAGLFHDLGKFIIPETVLARKYPLAVEERLLLSRHAEDGAGMSVGLGADTTTGDYIRHHHTRFDGLGSPTATRGQAIPLGARILAVSDAFVSMTSDRTYREARSFGAAVQELQRCRGGQFDPAVVDAVPRALLSRAPASI